MRWGGGVALARRADGDYMYALYALYVLYALYTLHPRGTLRTLSPEHEVTTMAMPIKPTPVLYDREAQNFERKIAEDVGSPVKVTCAPSLDKAKSLVFARDKQRAK